VFIFAHRYEVVRVAVDATRGSREGSHSMVRRPGTVSAGIVVTGSEIVRGRVRDRNGGCLAQRLTGLGIEVVGIDVVRDRFDEIVDRLRGFGRRGVDVIFVTGGMGSTPRDLTLESVAEFTNRSLTPDAALEAYLRLRSISASASIRDAMDIAGQRQAWVPMGATTVMPVGTAPGIVVPAQPSAGTAIVVCLPGPPHEARAMLEGVLQTVPMTDLLTAVEPLQQRVMRLVAGPELDETVLGRTVARAAELLDFDDLDVNLCAETGDAEFVIDTMFARGREDWYRALEDFILQSHGESVFSLDGQTIDEIDGTLLGSRSVGVIDLVGLPIGARLRGCASTRELSVPVPSTGVEPAELTPEIFGLLSPVHDDAGWLAERAWQVLGTDVGIALLPVTGDETQVAILARNGATTYSARLAPEDADIHSTRAATEVMHLLRRLLLEEFPARDRR
jgi:nicotinamide-nucleotide amidase